MQRQIKWSKHSNMYVYNYARGEPTRPGILGVEYWEGTSPPDMPVAVRYWLLDSSRLAEDDVSIEWEPGELRGRRCRYEPEGSYTSR
jgi:hypothetical protein